MINPGRPSACVTPAGTSTNLTSRINGMSRHIRTHTFFLTRFDQRPTRTSQPRVRVNGGDYGHFKDSAGQVGIVERAHAHTRMLTDPDQIESIKMHLLPSKEVSSELFESARQLSGLTCSSFVTVEAYAAQIALMVADVFPYFEWPSSLVHRGGEAGRAAARDTPSTIQVQKETGGKREREIAAPKY